MENQTEANGVDYYNPIFERLVDAADNERNAVIGMIAYSIYKISKREWVRNYRAENGHRPDEADMRRFAASQTQVNLEGYKAQAEGLLASYARQILAEEKPRIEKDALRGQFWSAVGASILGTGLFSLALLCLVLIAAHYGVPIPVPK